MKTVLLVILFIIASLIASALVVVAIIWILVGYVMETTVLAEVTCSSGTMQVIERKEKYGLAMANVRIEYKDEGMEATIPVKDRTAELIAGKSNKSQVQVDILDRNVPEPGTQFKKGYTDVYVFPNEVNAQEYERIVECSMDNLQTMKQAIPGLRSFIYANHNPFQEDYFCADGRIVYVSRMDDLMASFGQYDSLVSDGEVGGWGAHGVFGYIKSGAFMFPSDRNDETIRKELDFLKTCKNTSNSYFGDDYALPVK